MTRASLSMLLVASAFMVLAGWARSPVAASVEPQATEPAPLKPCDDVATCASACAERGGEPCKRAWEQLRDEPLAADFSQTLSILDRSCDAGEPRACEALVQVVAGAPGLPSDRARVDRAVARQCELGVPTACVVAGLNASAGEGPEAVRAAQPVVEKLCSAGDVRGCILWAGFAPEKAAEASSRAFLLAEERCLAKERDGCELASQAASLPLGVAELQGPAGRLRWRRFLRVGCELGHAGSCLEAADFDGSETPEQMRASDSLGLLDRSCERGSTVGCLMLAKAFGATGGTGAARGDARAQAATARGLALARHGCELGDATDCRTLALSLPLQGEQKAKEVGAWLASVCERPSPSTCSELAAGLSAWPALRGTREFFELKRRSCAAGYPFACPDPMRKLGVYVPIDAVIVDRRGGLEWAAPVPQPTPDAAGGKKAPCERGARLPSEGDLATLVGNDGALREFIRDTTPKRAALASASKRGSFDLESARYALDVSPVVARCVRSLAKGAKPTQPTLHLQASGADLVASLRPSSGAATTTRDAAEALWLTLPAREDGRGPTLEIVAAKDVAWPLVARVVAEARKQGWIVRRIWIE
jgi:hypothetical protein